MGGWRQVKGRAGTNPLQRPIGQSVNFVLISKRQDFTSRNVCARHGHGARH
jgi:hypothetical protein